MPDKDLCRLLRPSEGGQVSYKLPDYEYAHREMGKNGVTLTLLWLEYCDQCRQSGDIPYKSTQFNKYYHEYVVKTKATMHINRKPGELMEVDWAGTTAGLVDTDTGGRIPAYIFVAALPYSGYAYVEAFLSQDQECWISAHNNAYRFFGGVTRILVPDNLKTGVDRVSRSEVVINRVYQEMAEHYNTAVISGQSQVTEGQSHSGRLRGHYLDLDIGCVTKEPVFVPAGTKRGHQRKIDRISAKTVSEERRQQIIFVR